MIKNEGFSRRSVLKSSVLAAGALTLRVLSPGVIGAFAAPAPRGQKTKTIVSIFLRGGADALNMVIPFTDENYFRVRPRIAVPKASNFGVQGVVALDDRFGLHPGLAALKPLFDKKIFAPIVCTGSSHPTRSHFDAQDFMEYGAPGVRTMKSGWLNRYLEATKKSRGDGGLRGLAMQRLLPRAVRGEFPVLAVPDDARRDVAGVIDTFDDVYARGNPKSGMQETMPEAPADDAAAQVGRDTIETLTRLFEIVEKKADAKAPEVKYPRGEPASQLRRIAQVIKADAGLEVACVDVSGWDHHIEEGGSTGDFFRRTQAVSGAIAAFVEDLGPRIDDCLVVVMSEFGRTVYENGNHGTDHGHGSCILLVGGQVAGGKVFGKWGGLEDSDLYEGRDLVVTTDFRTVFDEILTAFMGFEPPRDFFPKYDRAKFLKFLR